MSDRYNETVQVRWHSGRIENYPTIAAAMKITEHDPGVWKVSFAFGDERVRLVRRVMDGAERWVYEPILPQELRLVEGIDGG